MRGNSKHKPPGGAYFQRGDLTEGFLRYELVGFIFGGAYTWMGLFSEFHGMPTILLIFELLVNVMFLIISTPGRIEYYPYF